MNSRPIPSKLYRRILALVPIVTVDLIIKTEKGVLLGVRKRKGEPTHGQLWIVGGRILYRESIKDAVKRKAKEETGLDVKVIRLVGVYTLISAKRGIQKRHNVSIVYLVRKTGGRLRLSSEYSRFLFIKEEGKNLHKYINTVLRDSHVFGNGSSKLRIGKNDYFVM